MARATAMAWATARARRTRARAKDRARARARDGRTDGRTAGRSYLFSEMRNPVKFLEWDLHDGHFFTPSGIMFKIR